VNRAAGHFALVLHPVKRMQIHGRMKRQIPGRAGRAHHRRELANPGATVSVAGLSPEHRPPTLDRIRKLAACLPDSCIEYHIRLTEAGIGRLLWRCPRRTRNAECFSQWIAVPPHRFTATCDNPRFGS
jgi:hypothetical protein